MEKPARHLVKLWNRGMHLDDRAREQLHNTAALSFIHKYVAVIPDVHSGMMAVQTRLNANELPDGLHTIRCEIEQSVPHGRIDNGGKKEPWRMA
mgnify:CR=1 FL=1